MLMNRAINNIDKNFHESFSAKGFKYLNAVGDTAPGPIMDASTTTIPPSRCPPGYEWGAGRCNLQVANPNSGGALPPAPVRVTPPAPKPTPIPGPRTEPPVPMPTPTPPFPTSYPSAGTLLGTYCAGVDKMGKYADGAGGYTTAVFEKNSTGCGYVAPAPPPGPIPAPLPSTVVNTAPAPPPMPGPISYPSPGGGGGGYEEPGGGYEEEAVVVAALPAEEINWPVIAIAGAMVGLTYWYMGKEKEAA
jgi:hypothetical protein